MPMLLPHNMLIRPKEALLSLQVDQRISDATCATSWGTAHDMPEDVDCFLQCQKLLHLAFLWQDLGEEMKQLLGAEQYGLEDFDRYWTIVYLGIWAPRDDDSVRYSLSSIAMSNVRLPPDDDVQQMWQRHKDRVLCTHDSIWWSAKWLAANLTAHYGVQSAGLHLPYDNLQAEAALRKEVHGLPLARQSSPDVDAGIDLTWVRSWYEEEHFTFSVWKRVLTPASRRPSRRSTVAEGKAVIEVDTNCKPVKLMRARVTHFEQKKFEEQLLGE